MIYCVEDDSSIRELMVYALCASGFSAVGFETAADFWAEIRKNRPRLILLDIMLPDEDGITILKRLRSGASTADIPVIMATAKSMEFDKVIGLDSGADDYLAKPFGMMEMVSRVKAVLRRTEKNAAPSMLYYRNLALNQDSRQVILDGVPIDLTMKEYDLLHTFLKHPAKVFTRENLLSAVWDTAYQGETRTVDVHIATLRTKLGNLGDAIKTVRGVGYRLEAPTEAGPKND